MANYEGVSLNNQNHQDNHSNFISGEFQFQNAHKSNFSFITLYLCKILTIFSIDFPLQPLVLSNEEGFPNIRTKNCRKTNYNIISKIKRDHKIKRTSNNTISPQELMRRHVSPWPQSIQPASTKHSNQTRFSSWTRKRGYLSNKNSTNAALNFSNQNEEAIELEFQEQLQHPNIGNLQFDIRDPIINGFKKEIPKYNVTQKPNLKKIRLSKIEKSVQNDIPIGPAKAKRFDTMTSIVSTLNRKVDLSMKEPALHENSLQRKSPLLIEEFENSSHCNSRHGSILDNRQKTSRVSI